MVALAFVVHHGCYCCYKTMKFIKCETSATFHRFHILYISCNVHLYCLESYLMYSRGFYIKLHIDLPLFSFFGEGGGEWERGVSVGCLLRHRSRKINMQLS